MNPEPTMGMHHVALLAQDFDAMRHFYVELLQLRVEWEPDADNLYLTSGSDNIAIHRDPQSPAKAGQRLDHIGFILRRPEDVDHWHEHLKTAGVEIRNPPKTHRDRARSFYCLDPSGTVVQMIYHPPISDCGCRTSCC